MQMRLTVAVILLWAGLLASGARAEPVATLVRYVDPELEFSIDHPAGWRRQRMEGPTRLLLVAHAGQALALCRVEHAIHEPPLGVTQARLDRDLVKGFRSPSWPNQLAGKRDVLDYQVRSIGGVPMGAIDWESAGEEDGRPRFARGIKLFRMTPRALWSAECAAVALNRENAEAYFQARLDLFGRILGSVRFPR